MSQAELLKRIEEFRRRTGHTNYPGCAVCMAIDMLKVELGLVISRHRVVDGVVITGPDA